MAVDIRQARTADLEPIQRFIREAYGPFAPYKGPDRWRWQFLDNPFRADAPALAPVWLAWNGDEVVGQVAVQPGRACFGGQPRDFGWILDVMVLDRFRGQRLGHRLYEAIAAAVPTTITLTMAPATRRMAEKQGALTLPIARSMFRPLRCDAEFLQRFLATRASESPRWQRPHGLLGNRRWASAGLAASMNAAAALAAASPRRRAAPPTVRFHEVDRFDAEVDELTAATVRCYDIICPRDHEYLNWRFVDAPHLRYRRFLMRDQGRLAGVLVMRDADAVELPIGIICELFVTPGSESRAELLLTHALSCFDRRMLGIAAGASAPWMVRLLRRRGFATVRRHHPTVVTQDAHVRAVCERSAPRCFFTKSDHDWDQIHPA